VRSLVLPLIGLVVACSSEGSTQKQEKVTEPELRKLAGVYPEKFDCKSLTTPEAIATLLGATKVNVMDSAMSPPRGVPAPCNYEAIMQSTVEYWTYDIDCRDNYKQTADALFAQYKRTSADLVEQYNAAADAGVKPTDAGIEIKAPSDASEVEVGAKGLDHHGQGLLFIDDDAPCYVRVIGPDAPRRLELAKAVAKSLTFGNAPMTPRPFK
jgi:hypothetical protein